MNILDIIIIAVIVGIVLFSVIEGLVKSFFGLFQYLAAAVVTYLFYGALKTAIINLTPIDNAIYEAVADRLKEMGANSAQATVSTSDLNAMQKFLLPDQIKESIINFLTSTISSATDNVVTVITDYILVLISMITLFIIALIVIKLLISILDLLSKLPVLDSFNKLGGALFGLIKAYIIISVVFMLAITFFSVNSIPQIQELIDGSFMAAIFINYNVFMIWFSLIPQ